jgi:hypothetical protein
MPRPRRSASLLTACAPTLPPKAIGQPLRGKELTRIAITGHMNLTPETTSLVRAAIRETLRAHDKTTLVGISCIAAGADQIFASLIVELGGRLEVILPSADYRERKVRPADLATFDGLLSRASHVQEMPFPKANKEAYEAANQALLTSADRLLAVWDGRPSDGAGTADVVEHARSLGLPIDIVWPEGAQRA